MRFILALTGAMYVSALAFTSAQQTAPPPASPSPARFDMDIRADFFAGISGDEAAFTRAMTRCEEILAQDPNHAEALVWHGSGLLSMGGMAFQTGDLQKGGELWGKGLGEMNQAVTLAPDNIAVRVPRGATLFEASRRMPDPKQSVGLLRIAVEDYEHALTLQQAFFAKLSDHAKGELLFGLADGWARLGDKEKATQYFTRLTADAAASGRSKYAKAWLAGDPPKDAGRCVGCH